MINPWSFRKHTTLYVLNRAHSCIGNACIQHTLKHTAPPHMAYNNICFLMSAIVQEFNYSGYNKYSCSIILEVHGDWIAVQRCLWWSGWEACNLGLWTALEYTRIPIVINYNIENLESPQWAEMNVYMHTQVYQPSATPSFILIPCGSM